MSTLREVSKLDYDTNTGTTRANYDELRTGALQRIADATEKMAESHNRLERDRDYWKGRAETAEKQVNRLCKQVWAYRGYIKRLKKNV